MQWNAHWLLKPRRRQSTWCPEQFDTKCFHLLQTLSSIGNEKNTTIIFPVPVDMISHFVGRNGQKQSSRLSPSSSSLPSESSSQKKSSIPRIQVITDQDEKETEEDTVDDDFLLRRSPSFFWTEQWQTTLTQPFRQCIAILCLMPIWKRATKTIKVDDDGAFFCRSADFAELLSAHKCLSSSQIYDLTGAHDFWEIKKFPLHL